MITDVIETLDAIARAIGWLAMIGFVLWLVSKTLEESRTQKEAQEDQANRFKFEAFLREDNPDRFRRYREIKERHQMNGEDVHWHHVAQESGVPIIDIIKDR